MLFHETNLWNSGLKYVAGIDEVGRGCLFGPVVAAAVILPPFLLLDEVDDSKKLTAAKRGRLYEVIMECALYVGIGTVDVATIEQINIKQASRLAMKLALLQLQQEPDYLLIDAEKVDSALPQLALIHGDSLSQSIAAASIIAKVTRDRMCLAWEEQFPGYGLAQHKGYATRLHRENIIRLGPTSQHRHSFLSKLLSAQVELDLEV